MISPMTETTIIRESIAALAKELIADEQTYHNSTYAAVRPITVPKIYKPRGMKYKMDCSKFCQFVHRAAGVPAGYDPMHNNYSGAGNSYTLWRENQHVDTASELLLGDFITFGRDGGEHAAVVIERGTDPLLASDGHQGAPNAYRLSADRREHQFIRAPLPKYVPTPQDKLRARTTWFAWMNWYDGTGEWKPFGKQNKSVRPNVPKRIPVSWWVRRTKFKFKANKPNKPTTAHLAV